MRIAGSLVMLLALGGGPAHSADPVRVGYAAQSIIFGGPVQAGLDQGFFAKLGLDVTPTTYGGGAKLHQAMAAGAEDIAMAAATDFSLLVKGAPEMAIYGVVTAPYSVVVTTIDPTIHTADDLKGRRVGVTTTGSYTYWFASQLPQFMHWTSGRAIPVSIGGTLSGQVAALVSGQVDAVVSDIALGLTLEQQGRGHMILNAADVVKDVPSSVVFAHNDLLRDRPDVARRFVLGVRQSLDYIVANREYAIDLAMRNTGFGRDIMSREVDVIDPGWSRDGVITPGELKATARVIVEAGLLDAEPDLGRYYSDKFRPK